MDYDVIIEDLHKSFGAHRAVDGLSLRVRKSELFGLIGPDGAGKSTLLRILVGLIEPDRGQCQVCGFDVVSRLGPLKKILGYMPQRFSLYPDLTVAENLRFYADLYQVPSRERRERNEHLLRFSRLGQFQNRRAANLSGGMKQKLALSCTLIHQPEILFLDEPTTGVDPVSRREFWGLLGALHKQGMTVFVTTAYMDEAARCDRVALMFDGGLVAVDNPRSLPDRFTHKLLEIRLDEPVEHLSLFKEHPLVRTVQVFGDRLHVGVPDTGEAVEEIRRLVSGLGRETPSVQVIRPGLEDVFVELIRDRQERISPGNRERSDG